MNLRLKTRPSINSLRRDDNSAADSDQVFNKFFTSVFTKEDCTSIPHRGGSRIYKRGGLTQGTNLLGRGSEAHFPACEACWN